MNIKLNSRTSIVLLSILACLPLLINSANDAASYVAQLNGFQLLANPSTIADGLAIFKINQAPNGGSEIEYTVVHSVINATGVYLHGPAMPGSNGPILAVLSLSSSRSINGILPLPIGGISGMNETIFSGKVYVNITSIQFPRGEIRGQVLDDRQSVLQFSGLNLLSPILSPTRGLGLLNYDRGTRRLDFQIELLGGLPPVTVTLYGVLSLLQSILFPSFPIIGSFHLTCDQEALFLENLLNLKLTSLLGLKRAENTIQSPSSPPITHVSNITRLQVVPANNGGPEKAQGVGQYIWKPYTYTLESKVQWSSDTKPTAAHLHGSAREGSLPGSPYLSRSLPPATNDSSTDVWVSNSALAHAMRYSLVYSDFHNPDFPNGVIRGQIKPIQQTSGDSTNLKRAVEECATTVDTCTAYRTCEDCTTTQGCGWCESAKTCAKAGLLGPITSLLTCTLAWHTSIGTCPCRQQSSCNSCISKQECGWCENTFSCGSSMSHMYQNCTDNWVKGYKKQTCDVCSKHTSCGACNSASGCGWCDSNSQCISGNSKGPSYGACPSSSWTWGYTNCKCKAMSLLGCTTCTMDPECGWCASTRTCSAGNRYGPTYGTCSRWKKTLTSCLLW